MQLIIKLYNDKPARIGVLYESEFKAGKDYGAILEKYRGETFGAVIEIANGKVNLILTSDKTNGKIEYNGLSYKSDQLNKLNSFVKPGSEIQFVHVHGNHDNLFVAKPNRGQKMEFVLIKNFEIRTPDWFPDQEV